MWGAIGELLLSLLTGALSWIALFVVIFAAIMLIIVGVVKISGKIKKTKPDTSPPPIDFAETPEYIGQICEVLRLLSDNDPHLSDTLSLFARDKFAFVQKYMPDFNIERDEDIDYWTLMLHALNTFGYLSYNDWKFSLEDALGNLSPVLKHYGIESSIYNEIPNKENIMEPEVCPMIATHLPDGYALADIYTGEDSYAITVAPTDTIKKVVDIADAIKRHPYNTGIQIVTAK